MAHLFCHSCGTKITYAHAKPNFCEKCGQQLNSSISANTSEGLPVLQKSVAVSQDETDADSVPVITNFQVEYDVSTRPNMTLGSLLGESENATPEGRREARQSVNEFIDEKKKEG